MGDQEVNLRFKSSGGGPGGGLPGRAAGLLAYGSELRESRRRSRPLALVLKAGTAFTIFQVRVSSTVRPDSRSKEMGPPLPATAGIAGRGAATRVLQWIRAEPGTQGPAANQS